MISLHRIFFFSHSSAFLFLWIFLKVRSIFCIHRPILFRDFLCKRTVKTLRRNRVCTVDKLKFKFVEHVFRLLLHVFFFFSLFLNSVLRSFQGIFSSYETGQSVGGLKRENTEKKKTLTHPQAELGLVSHVASAGYMYFQHYSIKNRNKVFPFEVLICALWFATFSFRSHRRTLHFSQPILYEKVQVGKDQEKAQSEKDSHSKNRGGKKPN